MEIKILKYKDKWLEIAIGENKAGYVFRRINTFPNRSEAQTAKNIHTFILKRGVKEIERLKEINICQ